MLPSCSRYAKLDHLHLTHTYVSSLFLFAEKHDVESVRRLRASFRSEIDSFDISIILKVDSLFVAVLVVTSDGPSVRVSVFFAGPIAPRAEG